ncbi:hypothetical protein D3C83_250200 [compost metagenome]
MPFSESDQAFFFRVLDQRRADVEAVDRIEQRPDFQGGINGLLVRLDGLAVRITDPFPPGDA